MKVFGKKTRKIKSKSKVRFAKAKSIAKRILPLGFAVAPGGLALGLSLSMAERQAQIGQELSTSIARQEFVDKFSHIDGNLWITAEDNASTSAREAKEWYLSTYPDATKEEAEQIVEETYNGVRAEILDLSLEDLQFFDATMNDIRENLDEEIYDEFCQSLGFYDVEEATRVFNSMLENAMNSGDYSAVYGVYCLAQKCIVDFYDMAYCKPFIENLPMYAEQQISEPDALGFVDAAMAGLSASPELGVLGALGTLGAAACGYGAYKYVESKLQDKEMQSRVDELFR